MCSLKTKVVTAVKPNPQDMITFLEVVESNSFTQAADVMGLTKSAISHAIKRLENDVGQKLLLRSTRALSITDAGTRILPHCRQLRETYALTLSDLQSMGQNVAETLTVTVPDALSQNTIVPVLANLRKRRPLLSLRLIADDQPMKLIDQKIDIAIRVGKPGPQTAVARRIGTLREDLYASKGYVSELGGTPNQISDLQDWNHIANEWQGVPVRYGFAENTALEVTPDIRCNSLLDIIAFVRLGLGVALLPRSAVGWLDPAGELVSLFEISSTPIYAVHQYQSNAPQKIRDFLTELSQFLRQSVNDDQSN